MENQHPPSTIPTTTTSSDIGTANPNNHDQFLHHLNKLSHKISKPSSSFKTPTPTPPPVQPQLHPPVQPPQQQQPPVYNINKSDFRDVVQRLTGSPAHAPSSSTPLTHAPKPSTSSRLQRIRPPPLAQLSLPNHFISNVGPTGPGPLSPLPPLPSCHAAAESPISAYMRFMHNTNNMNMNMNMMMLFPSPENISGSSAGGGGCNGGDLSSFIAPPQSSSPLPFGCLPSPKSPCPLLSPKLMLPPLSPTVPGVPSPK